MQFINDRILKRAALGIVIAALFYVPAAADEEVSVAKSLARHGLKMYDGGYYSISISDFSRSLLLEPDNPEIIEKLVLIGSKTGLTAQKRFNLYHFEDLIKSIQKNWDLIDYYRDQNEMIIQKLIDRGAYGPNLRNSVEGVNGDIVGNLKNALRREQNDYRKKEDPLKLLNASLQKQNSAILNELSKLKELNGALRQKQQDLKSVSRQYAGRNLSKWSYGKNYYASQDRGFVPEKKTNYSIRQSIDEGYRNTEKLSEDKDKIVEAILDVSEKDVVMQRLNEEILDLESRVELGQKIIKDKDEQMQQLEASVVRLEVEVKMYRDELNKMAFTNKREISKTNELLRLTTEKLDAATQVIEYMDDEYSKLAEKFDRLERKVAKKSRKKKTTLDSATNVISNIRDTFRLSNIKNKLFGDEEKSNLKASNYELQNKLASKDEKLLELNGIIQIYKAKLYDTNTSLKDRKNDIVLLEDELSVKDTVIQQAQNDINDLQKRLLEVEQQLQRFQKSEHLTSNKGDFKNNISDLQLRLKNINQYLIDSLGVLESEVSNTAQGGLQDIDKVLNLDLRRIKGNVLD